MIYGTDDLSDYYTTCQRTVEGLMPHLHKFDAIVVRGMSGVLVGGPVSLKLDKELIVVRKPGENSHHGRTIKPHDIKGYRVCFLDDFIAMGSTKQACRDAVEAGGGKLVCQYLYAYHDEGFEEETYTDEA